MFNNERIQPFEVVFEVHGGNLQLQRTPQSVQNFLGGVLFSEVTARKAVPAWIMKDRAGNIVCRNTNENLERLHLLCANHGTLLTVTGEAWN